ncbi:YbhN family protein [Thermodesulfobacteriota bacterium]
MNSRRSLTFPVILLALCITGILLLAYLLRNLEWELFLKMGAWAIISILGLTVVGTLCYATLVYLLIRGSGYDTTFWRAYLVLTSSLSTNYVTPVKVGIPVRIYLYHHFMKIPFATGTALVTVEALVGTLVPALLAIAGIAFVFPSIGLTIPIALIAVLLLGLSLILLLPSVRFQSFLTQLPFTRVTTRMLRFLDKVRTALKTLSAKTLASIILLDLVMLGSQALRLWVVLSIFGPSPIPLSLLAVHTISATAGNLSLVPMGLGVRDISFTLLLFKLGIPQEIALCAAVIQRIFSPGWPLLLGIISANVLGIKEILYASHANSVGKKSV